MNKKLQTVIAGTALAGILAVSGCSSDDQQSESFSFSGNSLDIVHDNAHIPVTVTSHDDGSDVLVEVTTQTRGQSPVTPAWSLSDGTLYLDSPCGGNWIGYCEGSYSVQVPDGVEVSINGAPEPVG
ncbi:hypothetical protein CJ199_02170 [Brevibacterium paucivorans]|uniref:Lipoprotein n=1 Tax=Brevibacterium paucivorans TaxID=170994 RepID=A0A2N6VQ24_9MICO|nr:hypothetical protein CJ199_02170 [Brevibacterium paucivorans]